ncbi:MAG: VOC family protein [Chloroflexota bacterium]|nr:VOC family protein [Chloroflexota bacterium]
MIGVRDLEEAAEAYRQLGFDVRPGGRHLGRGTHNALVRFGPEYLELMAIYDEDEAKSDPFAVSLSRFLAGRVGGLIGYVLASDDVAEDRARLTRTGISSIGPFAMSRRRADGGLLSWHMLVPGEIRWRRAWPTIIQWDQSAAERASLDGQAAHPNGVTHIGRAAIAVNDLEATISSLSRGLDLRAGPAASEPELEARGRTVALPNVELRLVAPTGPGPLRDELDRDGEGPMELILHGPRDADLPPDAAMGARLRIVTTPIGTREPVLP